MQVVTVERPTSSSSPIKVFPQVVSSSDRIAVIDTLRVFAIFAVILIHTTPFYMKEGSSFGSQAFSWFLYTACDLAVPFFLITSGYLYRKALDRSGESNAVYLRYLRRLLVIFLGWSFIYVLPVPSQELWNNIQQHGFLRTYYWHFQYVRQFIDPVYFLTTGTAGHLWFIGALIQAMTLTTVFMIFKKEKWLIYLSLLLFVFSPVAHLYVQRGLSEVYNWNPVIGPFHSIIFYVAGWWLAKKNYISIKSAMVLVLGGLFLHIAETHFLFHVYKVSSIFYDYGRLLMAIGAFMFALNYPRWGENTFLPSLGKFTLGVYCSHALVMDFLNSFKGNFDPYVWDIWLPVLVYLGALSITLLFRTNPLTRRIVS